MKVYSEHDKHILFQVRDLTTELVTRTIAAVDTRVLKPNFSHNPDLSYVVLNLNIKAERGQRK